MEKRRNCSLGAISPLFHNIFSISLTSRVQLNIYLLNVVNQISFFFPQFCKSDKSKYGYLEVFQRVPWNSRYRESTVLTTHSELGVMCIACKPLFRFISFNIYPLSSKGCVSYLWHFLLSPSFIFWIIYGSLVSAEQSVKEQSINTNCLLKTPFYTFCCILLLILFIFFFIYSFFFSKWILFVNITLWLHGCCVLVKLW